MWPSRWVCCQLGAREHYAVPRALHRRDALELLVTDTWVRPKNPIGHLRPGLRTRFHSDLGSADVKASATSSLAFELRARAAGLRGWQQIMARNEWFQALATKRLSRLESRAARRTVMAYSYAAREILRLARDRGWRTVLGQIDPGPAEDRIVARLYRKSQSYADAFERPPAEYWARWREECDIADRVVVNSAWSRAALIDEGVPAGKIRIVPLAYEERRLVTPFERAYPAAFSPSRPLRVLFLGQINLRKGIELLLDSIKMLEAEPIEFTFVGPIQLSIPQHLREHPNVRWIGNIPRGNIRQFYRDADVFVLPTFSDGFGITQLEAQAWKVPVVASKFCGEVVIDGENGCVLPDMTASAIAAVLRRCRAEPAWLQQMSDCSTVGTRFDLATIGDHWLRIFD